MDAQTLIIYYVDGIKKELLTYFPEAIERAFNAHVISHNVMSVYLRNQAI